MKNRKSLSSLFRNVLLIVTCSVMLLIGTCSISSEYLRFTEESEKLREQILESKKERIENRVNEAISGVDYLRMYIEEDMQKEIKHRVDEAYRRLVEEYEYNKNKLPRKTLQNILKKELRNDRFFNGRGYYFIFDMYGTYFLYPIDKSQEGKNVLYDNYSFGRYPMVGMIDTLKTNDGIFHKYYWDGLNGNDSKLYEKTVYIRKLPFYNWVIGTGDYSAGINIEIQKKALNKIGQYRDDHYGTLFVNKYNGESLLISSENYKNGDDIADKVNSDGVVVFNKQLKAAKNKSGTYVDYKKLNPKSGKEESYISYVRIVPEWEWIIGAYVSLSDIDGIIKSNSKVLYTDLRKRVFCISMLLLFTVLSILYISFRLRKGLHNKFLTFYSELKTAIKNNNLIDVNKFKFEEAIRLSEQTNLILDYRNEVTRKLENRERFLQTLIDILPLSVFYKDINGVYRGCNKEYAKLLGKKQEDVIGRNLYEVFDKKLADFLKHSDDRLFKEGGVQVYETDMLSDSGESKKVDIHKTLYYDNKGKVAGMLGVAVDITDRVKKEEILLQNEQDLKELNKTKDMFFSIIAHDLKNPFNSLLGVLEILIEDYDELDDDDRMEYLEVVNNSSNNLYKLLDNLLQWSRMQTSKIDFIPVETSIVDIINNVVELLKEQAGTKDINIVFESDRDVKATVDINMISTVVRNLLSNAIKFTRSSGTINISVEESEDMVSFTVKDNGVGIYKEHLDKLFDITEKMSTYGTNKEPGTGLGLILCKEFIDKHNGNIEVSSEIDVGTTFRVNLPK